MLLVADGSTALATVGLLVLLAAGDPGVAVYATYGALVGVCESFQQPAYLASVVTLVRKKNFGRAAGMLSLVESAPRVLAALAAGALLPVVGLNGLALLDVAAFALAMTTLLVTRFHEPARGPGADARGAWRRLATDASLGFTYIARRRSLLGLQLTFTTINLVVGMGTGLVLPLVNGSNQALWQAKVEPALQGRVFAARRVFAQITYPVGLLGVGGLIDGVFEPGMLSGDGWVWQAGRSLFGTAPGSGSALLMALVGCAGLLVVALAALSPSVRGIEDRLPDAVGDDPGTLEGAAP